MSQDLPSQFPEWASDPPVAPPTTITEPTDLQKAQGWQKVGSATFPRGKPIRQIMNWWQNLVWQWVAWLAAAVFRSSDVFADQPIPGLGSLPTLASGLSITAADFAGAAFIDGYRVATSQSPAHTYGANKDTYWDLGRSGAWTASQVNNGAGAPAVASHSVRMFKVVTNGSARTAVTDYRGAYLDVVKPMRFFPGSLANDASAFHLKRDDTKAYSLVDVDDTSTVKTRTYLASNGLGYLGVTRVVTINAYWTQASHLWTRDDNAKNALYWSISEDGQALFVHLVASANTWADDVSDSLWKRVSITTPSEIAFNAPIDMQQGLTVSNGDILNLGRYYGGLGAVRASARISNGVLLDGAFNIDSITMPNTGIDRYCRIAFTPDAIAAPYYVVCISNVQPEVAAMGSGIDNFYVFSVDMTGADENHCDVYPARWDADDAELNNISNTDNFDFDVLVF